MEPPLQQLEEDLDIDIDENFDADDEINYTITQISIKVDSKSNTASNN